MLSTIVGCKVNCKGFPCYPATSKRRRQLLWSLKQETKQRAVDATVQIDEKEWEHGVKMMGSELGYGANTSKLP
jgi:hypothetical protein